MQNIEQISEAVKEVSRQGVLLGNDDAGKQRLTALWEANQELTHQIENKIAEIEGLNG